MRDAFLPVEEQNYAVVMHNTWGHLFPQNMTEPIKGKIRIAYGIYRDIIILDEQVEIDGSPWWYNTLQDFLRDFDIEEGEVLELTINVHLHTHLKYIPEIEDFLEGERTEYVQQLEIELLKRKRLLKPLI